MEAFNDLSASRTATMGGPGPIPVTEIHAYCQMFEITDVEDRSEFFNIIRELDNEFLLIKVPKT